MATWGSAFATAFKILLLSLIWWIIGFILIIAGAAAIGSPIISALQSMGAGPTAPYGPPQGLFDFGSIILGLVLIVIGYLVVVLGTMASFLKYSAEYYAREFAKTTPPPPTAPTY
ncbi:MAG: hypothetical protein QW291_01695 [Thermofilaceae archaeon]